MFWDVSLLMLRVRQLEDVSTFFSGGINCTDRSTVPGSFGYQPEGASIYFNRTDVQEAINAPKIEWEECASGDVFVGGGDSSLPSSITVLPGVIERTQNVIIGHGALDMVL